MELPTYVQIEPVGQCNLRCQMCSIQFRQDGPPYGPLAFMDFEQFTRLIDQFVNVQELHLQGLGEPMMHPRFFDMVAYAADRGIQVSTNSNVTLLNDRRAARCVTSGLDTPPAILANEDGCASGDLAQCRPAARRALLWMSTQGGKGVRGRPAFAAYAAAPARTWHSWS